MNRQTKFGLITLLILLVLIVFSRVTKLRFNSSSLIGIDLIISKTFKFEFESDPLRKVVNKSLESKKGVFAVCVEQLPATPSATINTPEKYCRLENEPFPAASLYKLILFAAIFKEIENGNIEIDEKISSTKSHLINVYGGVDFGYEDAPENIAYTVEEALERVGRISDNFAAIMLTDRLRRVPREGNDKLLINMAQELTMNNTDFNSDPVITTASDIATFFRLLYMEQIVSKESSEKISSFLGLCQLNNRIPANLPKEIKVVHKTGEFPKIRHDAGIVYLMDKPYIIVMLTKDLEYEDDGIETLAQLSRDIFDYFRTQ